MSDVRKPTGTLSKPTRPLKVITAARQKPLTASGRPLKDRIRAQATDTALNVFSIVRESWEGFKSADRFLKFRVLIMAAWVVISIGTLFVACPGAVRSRNSLGAQLVVTTVADHPVYMVKNEGKRPWREVVVVVNKRFRAAAEQVEPGSNLTFGPNQLLGENGIIAPADLEMAELELRTSEGSAKLLEGGQLR